MTINQLPSMQSKVEASGRTNHQLTLLYSPFPPGILRESLQGTGSSPRDSRLPWHLQAFVLAGCAWYQGAETCSVTYPCTELMAKWTAPGSGSTTFVVMGTQGATVSTWGPG